MESMLPVLLVALSVYMIFLLVLLAFYVVVYVFGCLGLAGVAKSLGIPNSWLAFIPFTSVWILGKSADVALERKSGDDGNYAGRLVTLMACSLVFPVISIFINMLTLFPMQTDIQMMLSLLNVVISIFGLLISIPYTIVTFVCYYRLFELCCPDKAVLFLLLSIFVPTSSAFILFALRNKVPPLEDDTLYGDYVTEE